jgi:hypothetical protein
LSGLGVVSLELPVILGLDVGDVEEAVPADREVDERGLDRRLEVDDPPLVDVPGVALVTGPLDVKLLQDAVLDDGDPALLGLEHVDQHFFLHAVGLSGAVRGGVGLLTGPLRAPGNPRAPAGPGWVGSRPFFQIPGLESRISNLKSEISNLRFQISNLGSEIRDF